MGGTLAVQSSWRKSHGWAQSCCKRDESWPRRTALALLCRCFETLPHMHAAIVLLVLILTYIGMAAGRIAWLRVDRTGIALLAVIALLATREMTLDEFGSAVDMSTLALLFAMMII